MPKFPFIAAGVSALALGVAACGGSSHSSSSTAASSSASSSTTASSTAVSSTAASSSTAPAAGEQAIAADPSGALAYTKKTLSAKAGTVKIAFTNDSPLSHNLTIQKGTGPTGQILGATPRFDHGTMVLTVKLAPGTYTFYCNVPGHRMAGMQGTLTVG